MRRRGGGLGSEEHLTTSCRCRDAGCNVHRRTDLVTRPFDRRSVVHTDAHRWCAVTLKDVVSDPQSEKHSLSRIGDVQHERVSDRLDLCPAKYAGSSASTASQESPTSLTAS